MMPGCWAVPMRPQGRASDPIQTLPRPTKRGDCQQVRDLISLGFSDYHCEMGILKKPQTDFLCSPPSIQDC